MKLSILYQDCSVIYEQDVPQDAPQAPKDTPGAQSGLKPGTKKKAKTAFGSRMDSSGISGDNLSKKMGVHASTVSRLRHDVRNPGFDTMKKATTALGTDAEQLWPDIGA